MCMVWLTILSSYIRGERTAAAMETQLTALERKIDDLLASVDNGSSDKHAAANDPGQSKEKGAQS